ncbi:MAG: hypothetical protein KF894_24095 [Labilithrix sp.]|nr:hypothetical protein [Labilithrix sp.]
MTRKRTRPKPGSPIRTFSALVEAARDGELSLIVVPENRRLHLRASLVLQLLLAPAFAEPRGEVFEFTMNGDEIVNVVPADSDD